MSKYTSIMNNYLHNNIYHKKLKINENIKQHFINIDYIKKFPEKYKILLNKIRCKYNLKNKLYLKLNINILKTFLICLIKKFSVNP